VCWAERHLILASVRCTSAIEAQAQYSAEWTDGRLEPKFSRYRWSDRARGIVTYIGDTAKFQNGFGAWQNVIYECDVDPSANRVVNVRVRPGRIPQ
jgi:hypothetical protein